MKRNKETNIYPIIFISLFSILLVFLGLYKNVIFNDLFAEKFHFRTKLISWAMNIKFLVVKDNFFNNMYTKDHYWLNYTGENSLDDFQNSSPLTNKQIETIHVKLADIKNSLEGRGIKFYVIIPPNKNTIYPEDLENIAPKISPTSRLDQVVDFERTNNGINLIDLREDLLKAKEQELVYNSTDTHWNDYGSWVGYQRLIKVISQDFPQIKPNPIENYSKKQEKFYGGLAIISGNIRVEETTISLTLRNPKEVRHESGTAEGNIRMITSYLDEPELPTSLVFRDSFYSSLYSHMSQHFSKHVCLWTHVFDYSKVDELRPNIVILEVTERYINRLLRLP